MKLNDLLLELSKQEFFKKFMIENPDSFLTAGFFIFDLESNTNKIQLDFFLPKTMKIASIEHPFKEVKVYGDEIKEARQLNEKLKVDISDVIDRVYDLQRKNKNSMRIAKIIAILKDDVWNLTCLSSTMDILRIHINSLTGICQKFEKSSLADFMEVRKTK